MLIINIILKWAVEHAVPVKAVVVAFAVVASMIWIYHMAIERAQQNELINEFKTATKVKERYDEISSRRPNDRDVLDLLRAGTF